MTYRMIAAIVASVLVTTAHAQFAPPPLSEMGKKIQAAVDSDIRTAAEKERDDNRKPRETLEFFGLQDDMTVVELLPAGGWYTKILGPVLAENGKLYLALGTRRIGALVDAHAELAKVEILPDTAEFKPTEILGLFDIGDVSVGVTGVDMVLTFRNLHNFVPEARARVNRAAFEALKPGGLYGVVDHTRRHNEPQTSENWRRMDPVLAIKEIQAAGFELVDFSDLHYRPDDELRYEVGRKTVTGNSDRFTLLFRKPR
jgi:predicted methyltransferase